MLCCQGARIARAPTPCPPLSQAKAKVIGRMRVPLQEVVLEGRIKDQWPLLEAQVTRATCLRNPCGRKARRGGRLHSALYEPLRCLACLQTGEVHMSLEWNPVVLQEPAE